jgi:prephenate dehydrogenase
MKFKKVALIGCGLMGGSFAVAARRAGWAPRIVGFSASEASRQKALSMGVIDEAVDSIAQAVTDADVVLLAVPVKATAACFQAIAPALKSDALLMDVGSTKRDVVQAAEIALGDQITQFVPAHPIAGKELAGVAHADADLYQGCQVILTPTAATDPAQTARAQALWSALGCRVRTMSALAHDSAFAAVSHLPHMLAFAAMNALTAQTEGADFLALAGPGFRDFSRIAASDPAVWRDIFMANQDQLLVQSAHLRQSLLAFEAALQASDAATVQSLISQASAARAAWPLPPATTI